jgi:uncharacterized membrane protein
LLVAVIAGMLAAMACLLLGAGKFAILTAWDITILVYGCWVWLVVWPMSAAETKSHAVMENPGRALADILLVTASVASLVAVTILITQSHNSSGVTKAIEITLGLLSVVLSWGMVHTTYMLKYARLYYGQPEGGVNFNEQDAPRYTDFAYLAFTLGMTFQVSDTNLTTKEIRATALKHAMLSYMFGTVIIATMINTLASLAS